MTEAEWLAERRRPQYMLWTLCNDAKVCRTKAGRRKARLFACGCCWLIWEHLREPGLREAVEVAERHADGLAPREALEPTRDSIRPLSYGCYEAGSPGVQERTAVAMAVSAAHEKACEAAFGMTTLPLPLAGYRESEADGQALLCDLLRCVFGNPFRPATVAPEWRTANNKAVLRIARSFYDGRDFDRLPVLADALEDAGCDNPVVLKHLREFGIHARGCWVVDLILSKS